MNDLDLVPPSEDELGEGEQPYQGIPNAYGQYGVTAVYADVLAETAGDGGEGEPCVCIDTTMCETTLSIAGAEELVYRLRAAITDAQS